MNEHPFLYGAAYYPEHWDRSLWERDAQLMAEAGFNVVRLAEFAWVNLEPQEGTFEFGWLDDAIGVLANHGIQVILGTPTATIPAWLATRYPTVMAEDVNGHRKQFSVRKDYCVNDHDFDRLSMRIVQLLGEHYSTHPSVLGFQTDNEYLGSQCRCARCLAQFRQFLARKYPDIESLNEAWGTWFWGTRYSAFEEIGWPAVAPNPSHALDASRFLSSVDVAHNAKQVEVLRNAAPTKSITHNTHNYFGEMNVDFTQIVRDMDYASWDSYPRTDTARTFHRDAWASSVVWALKRQNFVVMEQQSGACGWFEYGPGVAPGEMNMLAWQSIARGADGILFFRWRTSISGQEQYWHGILNHDNVPRRRYREATELGSDLAQLGKVICQTEPVRGVGVWFSYEEVWTARCQMQNRDAPVHPRDVSIDIFGGLTKLGWDGSVFFDSSALDEYKTVILPVAQLRNKEFVLALEEWVSKGGTLVLLPRCGNKTENHVMLMEPNPGPLIKLAGIEVEEYAAIPSSQDWSIQISGQSIPIGRVREHLTPRSASVIGAHQGGYMDGWSAATQNVFGAGTVFYLGGFPTGDGWASLLPLLIGGASDRLPEGVEVARRSGGGTTLLFVINHTDHEVTATLSDLETDLPLRPYEVKVLESAQ